MDIYIRIDVKHALPHYINLESTYRGMSRDNLTIEISETDGVVINEVKGTYAASD